MPESEILTRAYPFMTTPPSPRCGACVYLRAAYSSDEHTRPTLVSKASIISELKSFLNSNPLYHPIRSLIFYFEQSQKMWLYLYHDGSLDLPLAFAYNLSDHLRLGRYLRVMRSRRTPLVS